MTAIGLFHLATIFGFGFMLGLQHAFDADHILTVSLLIGQTKSVKRSSILGALWGIGHTTTLLIVGVIILAFSIAVPKQLTHLFELFSGILLIVLGLVVLQRAVKNHVHSHSHTHGGTTHAHLHAHKTRSHAHAHPSFFVGMIHGLAGSAALLLVLLTTASSMVQGILLIAFFGAGSMAGMVMFSGLLGASLSRIPSSPRSKFILSACTSVVSILFGTIMLCKLWFSPQLI